MEIVLSFILDHWYLILWLVLEVIFGVLLLLKKSCSNEPLHVVVEALPKLIDIAEDKFGAGTGLRKKLFVLDAAVALFKKYTGIEVSKESEIYKVFSSKIEEILKTPQKKGGQMICL